MARASFCSAILTFCLFLLPLLQLADAVPTPNPSPTTTCTASFSDWTHTANGPPTIPADLSPTNLANPLPTVTKRSPNTTIANSNPTDYNINSTLYPNNASFDSTPSDQTCGFQGNPDTYGLGIRIGIYLQWIASFIAYTVVRKEAASMVVMNYSFLLANFIGLLYITFSNGAALPSGKLFAVECNIVLNFCYGGALMGSPLFTDEEDKNASRRRQLGLICRTGLTVAVLIYSLWYLYIGMDTMEASPCSRAGFFFAKVDLYHWFRTFQKITFTITAIVSSISFLILIYAFATRSKALGCIGSHIRQGHNFLGATYKLTFPLFVVGTELTIKWNHITGVNTLRGTGQILPFVVSGGSLVVLLYQSSKPEQPQSAPGGDPSETTTVVSTTTATAPPPSNGGGSHHIDNSSDKDDEGAGDGVEGDEGSGRVEDEGLGVGDWDEKD